VFRFHQAEVAQQEAAVRQQRINIEQQQLNLANQENQLKRKTELHRMKMIADVQIDDARYAVDAARIELRNSRSRLEQVEAILKQSNERLAKTNIKSPISGTITTIDIKVGETAVASQASIAGSSLMTIANTSTMITEVNVDEGDIGLGLGNLLGFGASKLIPNFPDAVVPWWAVLMALGFSSPVGILFGIMPAAKAANLNPIDALRYE
jgi:multidrug efflux pump subunit AcrA (membrane-fusion protein)